MADTLTKAERSARMALVRGKDTGPEMVVRRLVHGLGYRYRLHVAELPGKLDMVFPGWRKILFVHGCFWHWHAARTCRLARMPKSRLSVWGPKLEKNRLRDERHRRELNRLGWKVSTIWECQLGELTAVARKVRSFLE